MRAERSGAIGSWATQLGVPVGVLALANSVEPEASVAPSTRLLLPGKEAEPIADAEPASTRPRNHVVAKGDTLSGIARRHSMPLRELRRLNPRATGTLRIGQRLQLAPGAD